MTKTRSQLEDSLAMLADEVADRREAFFANPADIETIHRFRTRTRALRSLVAFVKPWQNARQNVQTQTILRDVVRYTSRLRELDVFEGQVRSDSESSPELLALCAREARTERAAVREVLISKEVSEAFGRAMYNARNVRWKKRYVERGLSQDVVRERFDALVESVRTDLADLSLSDAERTHDVRKRAKRARYVSEYNKNILGEDAELIAEGMMAHQDRLGDVCDARANIRLVGELLAQDLPEPVTWELNLMRARNEMFLYDTLKKTGGRVQ